VLFFRYRKELMNIDTAKRQTAEFHILPIHPDFPQLESCISRMSKLANFQHTKNTIDVMAVDNLPNELAKDASQYFGAQLMKFILPALIQQEANAIIDRGTMCAEGKLTKPFEYLSDYAYA
jgi:hypothetical protein